jgi:hypothetical protein
MGEFSNFLVFNSGEESLPNSHRIYFSFSTIIYPELQFSANPSSCKKP